MNIEEKLFIYVGIYLNKVLFLNTVLPLSLPTNFTLLLFDVLSSVKGFCVFWVYDLRIMLNKHKELKLIVLYSLLQYHFNTEISQKSWPWGSAFLWPSSSCYLARGLVTMQGFSVISGKTPWWNRWSLWPLWGPCDAEWRWWCSWSQWPSRWKDRCLDVCQAEAELCGSRVTQPQYERLKTSTSQVNPAAPLSNSHLRACSLSPLR